MIKYFKELLKTLKDILITLRQIESHLEKLSNCVVDRGIGRHGDTWVISTKHWNDS